MGLASARRNYRSGVFGRLFVKPALELVVQDVPGPAVFDGLTDIPQGFVPILYLLDNQIVMSPRNFSNKLLDKFTLARIKSVKLLHPMQIASGKPLHGFEFSGEILRNLLADVPVQPDKLSIDGSGCFDLRGLNTIFMSAIEA